MSKDIFLKKQRYEYYNGSTDIFDNETNELVEDVVGVLNQKDLNINDLLKKIIDLQKKGEELKQQLAEKDKEIENLKASSDKNIDYLIEFASLIENEKDCNRMLKALDRVKQGKKYIVDKEHQDKISFAVEQLEQLKYNIRLDNSDEETGDMSYVVDTTCLFELIDNQIAELTHQHEDKGENKWDRI